MTAQLPIGPENLPNIKEIAFLKQHYPFVCNADLADMLDISVSAIETFAENVKLRKSADVGLTAFQLQYLKTRYQIVRRDILGISLGKNKVEMAHILEKNKLYKYCKFKGPLLDELIERHKHMSYNALAAYFNCSAPNVMTTINRLVNIGRLPLCFAVRTKVHVTWSKDQLNYLKENFPSGDLKTISQYLKRSQSTVAAMAKKQKIKRKYRASSLRDKSN